MPEIANLSRHMLTTPRNGMLFVNILVVEGPLISISGTLPDGVFVLLSLGD